MSNEENVPQRPGEKVLTMDYLCAIARRYRCQFCDSQVSDPKWWGPHSGGWIVEGVHQRVWVYFECLKCKQQWGLNHIPKAIKDAAWEEVQAKKGDMADGLPGGD